MMVADVGNELVSVRSQLCCHWQRGAVADLLGHSSISITGDVYGHTSDTTARAAVDALANQPALLGL
jgi:integrase